MSAKDVMAAVVAKERCFVLDAAEKALLEEVVVPSWFSVDVRLGSLAIKLEASSAYQAELYAVDAGLAVASDDIKVNLGEHVLRALFACWSEAVARMNSEESGAASTTTGAGALGVGANAAASVPAFVLPRDIVVFSSEERVPVPVSMIRRKLMQIQPREERYFPPWVVECVRDGKSMGKEVSKLTFMLQPAPGDSLPMLSQTRLTAPRILRVRKVINYVVRDMSEQAASSSSSTTGGGANSHQGRSGGGSGGPLEESELEIVCNNRVLPLDMSLAAVRHFVWRSPEELELLYRRTPTSQ